SEVLHQFDLLVSEWTHFLVVNDDSTDQGIVLEHRHTDNGSRAAECGGYAGTWISSAIGTVDNRLCPNDAAKDTRTCGFRTKWPALLLELGQRGWRAKLRGQMHDIAIVAKQSSEFGTANAHGILQHGLEYRLQRAGRGTDDFQHFGGRGLALARLIEFAGELVKLVLQVWRGCAPSRRFARLGPIRAPAFYWLSASTASLHVAPGRFTAMLPILRKFRRPRHVRFGSKADICGAKSDVRFGSKADICVAKSDVRFTPVSDINCDVWEYPLWAKSGHRVDYEV